MCKSDQILTKTVGELVILVKCGYTFHHDPRSLVLWLMRQNKSIILKIDSANLLVICFQVLKVKPLCSHWLGYLHRSYL